VWFRGLSTDADDLRLRRLAADLELDRFQVLGLVTAIRCWTVANAPDGDLRDFDEEDIAWAIRYDGDLPRELIDYAVDGWEDRAEGYKRAAKARERRAEKRAELAPKPSKRKAATKPRPEPERPPQAPLSVVEAAPAPVRAVARRQDDGPTGGAVVGWRDGAPLVSCAGGAVGTVLQWSYLAASAPAALSWLLSPDAARALARVEPGHVHRAIERALARSARAPTIAERLAEDARGADGRQADGLAGAAILCAAVGRISEPRARMIAAELAAAEVDGEALSRDEIVGGLRRLCADRAAQKRTSTRELDAPELFDVIDAVKRHARDGRARLTRPAPTANDAAALPAPAAERDDAAALAWIQRIRADLRI
jgi:hypothetical protein